MFSEIVKLADEDNENDEYHAPVPIVDVWLSYKALADMGWTQQRIAKAKGATQRLVSFKLKYASLPGKVIDYFRKNDFLKESHAAEIVALENFSKLEPWLTREDAMLHVVNSVY
jgi:ParB-like chromosome segregation protein Spo0J